MVVRVPFPCKNRYLSFIILIMTELVFATYNEFVLLTKAWKIHGSSSNVAVNILIGLASNSARYVYVAMGGKLAINCHPDINTCPIYIMIKIRHVIIRTDLPRQPSMAVIMILPLACGYLRLLSTTFIRAV